MLIGLAGYAGAGKDTVGKILIEEHGFRRIAFADNVKRLALAVDPMICDIDTFSDGVDVPLSWVVEREGWDTAKRSPQVRELLQRIGQGVREVLHEEAWIDAALNDYSPYGQHTVITDVRYPNELTVIQENGGVVIWVARPGVEPANDHPSENSGGPGDSGWVIHHRGDLGYLRAEVATALSLPGLN